MEEQSPPPVPVKTFREKLRLLSNYFSYIIKDVRDDMEIEYLGKNPTFVMSYFPQYYKKDLSTIPLQVLVEGLSTALEKESETDAEELAVLIAQCWILRHVDIYDYFESQFKSLGIDYENELKLLSAEISQALVAGAEGYFGATLTYMFVTLNSVLIDRAAMDALSAEVRAEWEAMEATRNEAEERQGLPIKEMQCLRVSGEKDRPRPESPLYRSRTVSSFDTNFSYDDLNNLMQGDPGVGTIGGEGVSNNGSRHSAPSSWDNLPFKKRKINILKTSKGSSFILPRSDTDYLMHLRSQFVKGYLLKKSKKRDKTVVFRRRWAVLKDAKLYYYKTREQKELSGDSEFVHGCIPLIYVTHIRTAPKHGDSAFSIGTVSRSFVFKADTVEESKKWLLGMHSSLAKIVEDIVSPHNLKERVRVLHTPQWWKYNNYDTARKLQDSGNAPEMPPITVSSIQRTEGLWFVAVMASTQGHRGSMEDEHCIIPDVNQEFHFADTTMPRAFFAVFDGHGGAEAAAYAKEHLARNIFGNPQFSSDPRAGILEAFKHTDAEFSKIAISEHMYCGTTAVAIIIQGNKLITANLGDSRAVLCNGLGVARPLSVDHKPSREDERQRIQEAGGWIVDSRDLNISQLYRINPELIKEMQIPSRLVELVGFITTSRICGELSVSRAIGDIEYKGHEKEEYWETEFSDDLVIAVPDIDVDILSPSDLFLLLACDGLWDVFSNQEAVDFVREAIQIHHKPEIVARKLIEESIKKGSMDNISVCLVMFK